jgi:uncharacterized protein DUF6325
MALGPIELLVLGFPTDRLTGKVAEAFADLVRDGTIRLVDVLVAMRNDSGDLTVVEVDELGEDIVAGFQVSGSDLKGSLTEEDAHTMAGNLAPGRTMAIILYENAWATKVAEAIRGQNGEVLVHEPIPRAVIEEMVSSMATESLPSGA